MADTWTPDMIDKAAKLHRAGESLGTIAMAIGVSRSAVSGFAHRNRDMFPAKANGRPQTSTTPRKRQQTATERRAAFHAVKTAEEQQIVPAEPVGLEINGKEYDAGRLPHAKELVDLGMTDCRWPIDHKGAVLFCCADASGSSSYCAHHAKRSLGPGTVSERKAGTALQYAARKSA